MESKRLSEDNITNLPSSIMETILCLVPIRDAIRTSILSKKWRYNWAKIPKLVFNEKDMFNESHPSSLEKWITTESQSENIERIRLASMTMRCKVLSALQQVMLTYQGPIVVFSLSMDLVKLLTCAELDQIITSLTTHDTLKKFSLDFPFFNHDCDDNYYRLPLSVFSWAQLTDLYLSGCVLDFKPTFGGWGSLTSLYLDNVDISQKTLLHLISPSPLLKSVSLFLQVENVIGYTKDDFAIVKLFDCLPLIEHLTLCIGIIQWFFNCAVPKKLPKTLIHLKYFYLSEMTFDDNGFEIPFIFLLIRSSPNLEKIKLQILGADEVDPVRMEDYSDICLEHLNELEIKDFFNSKNELEFVKLILAKSPVLKKVNIFLDREVTYDDEMVLLTTLLRAPRQSREVEISVEW